MRRFMLRGAVLALGVAGFFAGLFFLGRWALDELRGQDRYAIALVDIDCPAPPGMTVAEFLDEVHYDGRLPERFSVLEEGLSEKLAAAFRMHPWVSDVDEVAIHPPRHVQVRLTFRRPVLAIKLGEQVRVVDGEGILLPKQASAEGLPVFAGNAKGPQGTAGSKWGDPEVERRARESAAKKNPSEQ